MKKGTRVEYTGSLCLMHNGKRGTVQRIDRKGWFMVQFDGEPGTTKCAEFSLRVVEKKKPGASAR